MSRSCISLPYKQFKISISSAQKFHHKVPVSSLYLNNYLMILPFFTLTIYFGLGIFLKVLNLFLNSYFGCIFASRIVWFNHLVAYMLPIFSQYVKTNPRNISEAAYTQ